MLNANISKSKHSGYYLHTFVDGRSVLERIPVGLTLRSALASTQRELANAHADDMADGVKLTARSTHHRNGAWHVLAKW